MTDRRSHGAIPQPSNDTIVAESSSDINRHMSVSAAARRLNISTHRLYQLAAAKRIVAVAELGATIKFKHEDVERLADELKR